MSLADDVYPSRSKPKRGPDVLRLFTLEWEFSTDRIETFSTDADNGSTPLTGTTIQVVNSVRLWGSLHDCNRSRGGAL